jgi:DNA-directed RNA polymerase specialized sigma24 family protein
VPSDDQQLLPLIEAMACGDRVALRSFIEHVGPMIHAAHLRATGQSVAAAVLTERSLEDLWRSSPLYDAHYGQPGTWVMAVARLHAVDFVAPRRGKEGRLKSSTDVASFPPGPGGAESVSPPDPAAAAALAGLDPTHREFLVDLWHRGIPGGSAGADARARLTELLPAWAELLAEGTG